MSTDTHETKEKLNIYDFNFDQLVEELSSFSQPAYRIKQIWQWIYQRYVGSFAEMTNLPLALRQELDAKFDFGTGQVVDYLKSRDQQTTKVLFQLPDEQLIETVLMVYRTRRTLCISTQAGCAMGCVFCATGQMGFFRNLSSGEIVAQVLYFARQLAHRDDRLTNIVLMGMGEPLHNYEQTLAAVDRLIDSSGFNIGARKITISTVGLVPAIRRYADEKRQTPLAISLHAATDEERGKLIPVNRRWPIDELMAACRYYIAQTGRRLTFEWALINQENDTREQAAALGYLLKGMLCHVNLIPLNPTDGYGGGPSELERVEAFQAELARFGVSSTVRVRRGIDIQAGCGQLRDRHLQIKGSDKQ